MNNIIESLRKRYPDIHPLIYSRSVERSNSPGELFDILENIPKNFPITWDEVSRSWIECNLLRGEKKLPLESQPQDD